MRCMFSSLLLAGQAQVIYQRAEQLNHQETFAFSEGKRQSHSQSHNHHAIPSWSSGSSLGSAQGHSCHTSWHTGEAARRRDVRCEA